MMNKVETKKRRLSGRSGIPPFILFLACTLVLILTLSFLAPLLFPLDLAKTDLRSRLLPPSFVDSSSPYLFGTDNLGRDVAVRLLYAINTSMRIAFTGMIIAASLGVVLGSICGLAGRIPDMLISFITDMLLSIPGSLIGIVCACIFGANERTLILIIGFTGWSGFCRLVRGQVIQLKQASFIECSRALGATGARIFREHILANIASPLIVQITMSLSAFLLMESSLSFIGLGIQPPETSLGVMVSVGRDYMLNSWWLAIIPSIVIIVLILQFALIGDWLRDRLDPKLQQGTR